MEVDEYRMNGYSEIEREKVNLIDAISNSLEQLENYKNDISSLTIFSLNIQLLP